MSAPEEILVARLKAISAVAAIVGTRVYPAVLPQKKALPAIVYEMMTDVPSNSAGGATGTHETRIEVLNMATTYPAAKALAAAVQGNESSTAPTGVSGWTDGDGNVWHLDNQSDESGQIEKGQDTFNYYGVSQEFVVWN